MLVGLLVGFPNPDLSGGAKGNALTLFISSPGFGVSSSDKNSWWRASVASRRSGNGAMRRRPKRRRRRGWGKGSGRTWGRLGRERNSETLTLEFDDVAQSAGSLDGWRDAREATSISTFMRPPAPALLPTVFSSISSSFSKISSPNPISFLSSHLPSLLPFLVIFA